MDSCLSHPATQTILWMFIMTERQFLRLCRAVSIIVTTMSFFPNLSGVMHVTFFGSVDATDHCVPLFLPLTLHYYTSIYCSCIVIFVVLSRALFLPLCLFLYSFFADLATVCTFSIQILFHSSPIHIPLHIFWLFRIITFGCFSNSWFCYDLSMTNTVCCLFHRIAYFSVVLSAPTYFSIHLISMCRFFRILPHVLCCYIVIMHYSCNRMGVLFVGMNNKMQHKIQRQTTMTSMMPFTLRVGRERETEKEGETLEKYDNNITANHCIQSKWMLYGT